jgi:hypothetical protein
MLKSLRVPERLFQLAAWGVSLLFAWFLIGLGGKLVADLPGVPRTVTLEQFVDSAPFARLTAARDALTRTSRAQADALDRARLDQTTASNSYRAARAGFENWVATRTATVDPRQDPEVVRRTRDLDALKAAERGAEARVEDLERAALATAQALERRADDEARLREDARGRFERARLRVELRVFAVRLALTLPLLGVAGWLVARKRRSEYWPLARGFVLFALFAFFVELVPYLPSYGGYVRYGVGVAGTVVAGVWVIRAMRRYVARRQAVEQQSEGERRRALGYEEALRRMGAGVCPGCERPVAGLADARGGAASAAAAGSATPANFCVHCGMTLFDHCPACSARKNAFFQYCPSCGVPAGAAPAAGPGREAPGTAMAAG